MRSRVAVIGLAVLAVFLAGALFVQFGVLSRLVPFLGEDDRPPIIVQEGSLEIRTADSYPWKEAGSNRKWKPDQPKGKSVTQFTVTAVDRANNDSPLCDPMKGSHVSIEYTVGDVKRWFRVYVDVEPGGGTLEPAVWSPVGLGAPTNDAATKETVLRHAPVGEITSVEVTGGDPCPIGPNPKVRVEIRIE